MLLCPDKHRCKEKSPFNAKFCAFCGTPLVTVPSWSNAGYNCQRTSAYPSLKNGPSLKRQIQVSMDHSFVEDEMDEIDVTNLPQPIMAHNMLWVFATRQASLFGIKLSSENGHLIVPKDKKKWIESNLNMNGTPVYANTPVYDGVYLNLIYDDKFARISTYDGLSDGQELTNNAFEFTQKVSPVITEAMDKDTKKMVRYFITALKEYILVVDISSKGDESYVLIPWGNKDGEDEIRSPVCDGEKVYFLTKDGKRFCLPVNVAFSELEKLKKHESLGKVTGVHFYAPLLISSYMIAECFKLKKDGNGVGALMAMDLKTKKTTVVGFNPKARENYAKSRSYLPGICINDHVYFSIRNNIYERLKPGLRPEKKEFRKKDFPEFWPLNAISVGSRLIVYNQRKNQLIIQETSGTFNDRIMEIHSNIDRKPLCGQPLIFGKILVLYFLDKIVFFNI